MPVHADSQEADRAITTARAGGLRWRVRLPLLPQEFRALLQDPDAWLADPAKRLAHSELITMAALNGPDGGEPKLLLRRLNYGRWRHRLRDVFRPTRAERAFKHGMAMEQAGVPTPRVMAVAVERCWRWPVRAYLLMEFVPRAQPLRQLLMQQKGVTPKQTRQLAEMMARLHQAGFTHRDLNATNILFNAQGEPCFIDLDGVRRHRVVSRGRAIKNLARLAREFIPKGLAAAAPWFLKHYCARRGLRRDLRALHVAVQKQLTPFLKD
jgi:tRNA A-37 threonylcarbamoyl transferase component Bud32